MSDENIFINVDDAAVDDAIAKLEEALEKQAQLTGQPIEAEQAYIIGADEMVIIEKAEAAKQHVADVVSEGELELMGLQAEADAVKAAVAEAVMDAEGELTEAQLKIAMTKLRIGDETDGIKGLESSTNMIIRMIPGLREANSLNRSLQMLQAGNVMGAMGVLLLAYSLYRQISAMIEEQKKQQTEYRRDVMEARGFALTSEFDRWQEDQRQLNDQYRLTSIGIR